MSSVISKWVLPGVLTVAIGTVGTLFFTQSTIETDLTEKSTQAASASGIEQLDISFNGRDGLITGVSTNPNAADTLVSEISGLHGVRSIVPEITTAPTASPYSFKAVLNEGGAIALSGAVPSFAMRDALLEQTGGTDAGLELMSGAPEGDWLAATGFAVSQLDGLEQGEATLSDLSLSVAGVAKTLDTHSATSANLMGALPDGLELANASIDYPVVADYTFNATRVDGMTTLSGFVPNEETRAKIGALTDASTDGLVLASGAPQNFVPSITYGLGALGHLTNGELNVNAADIAISGEAANAAELNMANALLSAKPVGANVTMAQVSQAMPAPTEMAEAEMSAPAIAPAPYFWSTQKRADGSLTIRGFVPDDAARAAILARAGEGAIDRMQIQHDAPATFYEDALVSISALKNLQSGRAGYSRGTWFLTGQPGSIDAKANAQNALITARTHMDKWNVTLEEAPDVVPYTWTAEKFTNGRIFVSGLVPNDATRTAIMARAGGDAIDNMRIANGAPATFHEDALVGVSAIKELVSGRTGHSANGWFLNGLPKTVAAKMDATNSLATARTMADNWNVNLADAPDVVPYTWSAEKSANGDIAIVGHVPDNATRAAIMARAGAGASDHMITANGAPATFYEDSLVGLSSLSGLNNGRTGHSASGWFLIGDPATPMASDTAINGLNTARTKADKWYVSLSEAPPIPVIPYAWSAVKADDGTITLAGNVPDEATRAAIVARAGAGVTDNMAVSFGAPDHFYEDALVAVSAASQLTSGKSGHGGSGWYLFGETSSNEMRDAATNSLLTARTHSDDWYVSIPEHPEMVEEEMAEEEQQEEAVAATPEIMLENTFEAVLMEGEPIALSGMVPSNRSRTYLGQISGGVLTSGLTVSPRGAPDNFAANSRAGIRGLHRLIEGRLAYEGGVWSLVGRAQDTTARTSAIAQISDLANYRDWQVDIATPTFAQLCQTQINEFGQKNTIEFTTASAEITAVSLLSLQELVSILHLCPDASVHVEGHTDSQGDFIYNLGLSSERADSVAEALSKFGIAEDRLLTVGFGEDRPIASNDTAEGRQANRRIVFTVVE